MYKFYSLILSIILVTANTEIPAHANPSASNKQSVEYFELSGLKVLPGAAEGEEPDDSSLV